MFELFKVNIPEVDKLLVLITKKSTVPNMPWKI